MRDAERVADARARARAREDAAVRDAEARARARAREDAAVREAERRRDKEARARARRLAKRTGDGDMYLAAPDDMPPDSYFATFEQNPVAAQSLLWAGTYNWKFEHWRDIPFDSTMPSDEVAALLAAMNEEAEVTYSTMERCMAKYELRCPPGQPTYTCASCGHYDVPTHDNNAAEAARTGVTHFHTVPYFLGGELNIDLLPLVYTEEQLAAYDLPVPPHMEDTVDNRALWTRYKVVRSSLLVRTPRGKDVRLHLYPEVCGVVGGSNQPPNLFQLPAVAEDTALEGHVRLCGACYDKVRLGQTPDPSIAAGWDLKSSSSGRVLSVS